MSQDLPRCFQGLFLIESKGGTALLIPCCVWASRSGLTLAFVAGEQHQVVPHSRGVIGQRELQPELVEEGEARQGGVSRE